MSIGNQLPKTLLIFKRLPIGKALRPVFSFLVIVLCWNVDTAFCQRSTPHVLDSIQNQVSKEQQNITNEIAIWHRQMAISGPAAKIDSIKLYPVIRLSYFDQQLNKPSFSTDTALDIIAVTYPNRSVYVYKPHVAKLSLKGNTANIINGLIDKALADRARQSAFVYFFDIDRFQPDLLAYLEQGSNLKFVLNGNEKALTVEEVLDKKFGEKSNYFLAQKNEKVRMHVVKNVAKLFKETALKDNWQFYAHFFPKDTTRIMALLINDVKKSVQLSDKKLKELKKALLKAIREPQKEINVVYDDRTIRYYKYYGRSPYIMLFNKDIAPVLKASMDQQKYEAYNMHAEIGERLNAMMQKTLQERFKDDKAAIKAFIDSSLKNSGPVGYYIQNELHTPVRMIR